MANAQSGPESSGDIPLHLIHGPGSCPSEGAWEGLTAVVPR